MFGFVLFAAGMQLAHAAGPQVQIAVGRSYEAPATFFVSAEVSGDQAVQWLALSMNGTELTRVSDASLEYEVRNLPAGTYNFTATARDYAGRSGSATKQVEVVAANQAPTVSLILSGGTQYSAPATIALAAQYGDADGTVTKIEYFANNVWVGNSMTAPFTAQWSNVAPGQYQMIAWAYDDKGKGAASAPVTVVVGTAEAEFVDQAVPATMVPGVAYPVTVRMKNTGTVVWRAGERYRLGSQNPSDNHNWGLHRVELPADVAPGQIATFVFSVTAPATVGTYDFQWRMLQEGVRWFGASTTNQSIRVSIPPARDAGFVSQSVPGQMNVGATYPVNVKLRNTGTSTWRASDQYKLGSQNPHDNGTWNIARVELAGDVAPGQIASFDFNVKAPVSPGDYNFQWRMLQEGVAWFGEVTPNQVVQAMMPPPSPMLGTKTIYDALGRTISVRQDSELGVLATDTAYSGLATVTTDPRGKQVLTSYQAFAKPAYDRPVAIQAPEDMRTEIQRDIFGKVTILRRRNGDGSLLVERALVYDAHQRLCKIVEPETGATVKDYDLSGNVAWTASGLILPARDECNRAEAAASAHKVDRGYDERNRLRTLAFSDGRGSQAWSYYPDGQVKEVVTSNEGAGQGEVVNRYGYNKRRLLISETVEQAGAYVWTASYAYDSLGNVRALTYPSQRTVEFAPNALGQPTKAVSASQIFATGVKYHPNGTVAQFAFGNGLIHTVTQNARQLSARSQDGGIVDLRSAYDANGNVIEIIDGVRGSNFSRWMSYDDLDRLVSAGSCSFGGDCWHRFSYDALDNIKTWSLGGVMNHRYYYDVRNQLTNIRDGDGVAVMGLGYDEQGNLENKNGRGFAFDYGNRLRRVADKEWYRYDAQGRRVQSTLFSGAFGLSMYSQTGQLLYTEDGRTSVSKATEHIYLDATLIATSQIEGAGAVTVRYQHTDALGSPVAVTDAAGTVIERTEWEPYGGAIAKPAYEGVGFTGHVMDGATGLTYMQQRYYDPQLGKFLSVDPVNAYDAGDLRLFNRYTYAYNNPYRYTDPDGQCPWCVGAVIGIGLEVARQAVTGEIKDTSFKGIATNLGKAVVAGAAGAAGAGLASGVARLTASIALRGALNAAAGSAVGVASTAANNAIDGKNLTADMGRNALLGGATGALGSVVGDAASAAKSALNANAVAKIPLADRNLLEHVKTATQGNPSNASAVGVASASSNFISNSGGLADACMKKDGGC